MPGSESSRSAAIRTPTRSVESVKISRINPTFPRIAGRGTASHIAALNAIAPIVEREVLIPGAGRIVAPGGDKYQWQLKRTQ
jgi:hypothetical protein